MKALIFSDEDLDGVLSARLAKMAKEAEGKDSEVIFQDWYKFGIDRNTVLLITEKLRSGDYNELFVLDIGSHEEMLGLLKESQERLRERGIEVGIKVFDNHPPEGMSRLARRYGSSSFSVKSVNDNSTAGLVFKQYEKEISSVSRKWGTTWALLGVVGDVAYKKGEGKEIYEKLLAERAELSGKRVTVTYRDGEFIKRKKKVLDAIAQYFHVPRRIAFNEGALSAFLATEELERIDDIFALETLQVNRENEENYPHIVKLRKWMMAWPKWSEIFKTNSSSVLYEYPDFVFMIIENPWNIGSSACNVKSNDYGKTAFCLNYGIPGFVHLAARNPSGEYEEESKEGKEKKEFPMRPSGGLYSYSGRSEEEKEFSMLPIGKVLARASELSSGKMEGGGLDNAGSAIIKSRSASDILGWIQKAVSETGKIES